MRDRIKLEAAWNIVELLLQCGRISDEERYKLQMRICQNDTTVYEYVRKYLIDLADSITK